MSIRLSADEISFMDIPNYKILTCFYRSEHIRGGTLIYSADGGSTTARTDVWDLSAETNIECCAHKYELNSMTMGSISLYRPLNGILNTFIETITSMNYATT